MAYYRVMFRFDGEGENQYEYIQSTKSIEHLELDIYFDEDTEILEIRQTTPEEVIAYENGRRQGWEDFEDYLSIENRMKHHNGHMFHYEFDERLDAIEMFICGICQKLKEKEDLSGETVPVGTYETPWDVCKGCASK